jgi:hypothetical protein
MKTKSLKVKTGVKGGKLAANHSRSFKVKTGLKGGRLAGNHSRTLL